jgi:hypothetical protein
VGSFVVVPHDVSTQFKGSFAVRRADAARQRLCRRRKRLGLMLLPFVEVSLDVIQALTQNGLLDKFDEASVSAAIDRALRAALALRPKT